MNVPANTNQGNLPPVMTDEQVDLLKRTICKDADHNELALFLHACERTGLDPFMKQIHAVKRWDSRQRRHTMTIQTGIDGLRLIADRTGKYCGSDEPIFDDETGDHPNKATVTVWKLVNGVRCPFTASARWREYRQTKKDGNLNSFWKRMPFGMLAKCAESLALRKAFPADMSGIYTFEEMAQADNGKDDQYPANYPAIETTATPEPTPTKAIDPTQMNAIEALRVQSGIAPEGLAQMLSQRFNGAKLHELTGEQADRVIAGLKTMGQSQKNEPASQSPESNGQISRDQAIAKWPALLARAKEAGIEGAALDKICLDATEGEFKAASVPGRMLPIVYAAVEKEIS